MSELSRLDATIRSAGIPIDGIAGSQGTIRIDFKPEATQPQRDAAATLVTNFDWSEAAHTIWDNLQARSHIITLLTNSDIPTKLSRALVLVIRDELNLHAVKINAILAAAAAATTLANFKTGMAAIADYPQRSIANLITALEAKINAGDVD